MKNLVIVESPSKAKTIEKYLGKDYKVVATVGHVIDLPKSKLGVDIESGQYEPEFTTIRGKGALIKRIKKDVPKDGKGHVYLAMDPDREGEAIAWHIANALKLKDADRIVFHEITKKAVNEAIKQPRKIDEDLVNAQIARRVLDRLVGYPVSQLLWHKIWYGLSAGRVQSVALRLIVEREKEIEAFIPDEFWNVLANFEDNSKNLLQAKLSRKDGKKYDITEEKVYKKLKKEIEGKELEVVDIKVRKVSKKPYAPFTTSTLQQAANNIFGYTAKRTMGIAQGLYQSGHITYMRTDSTFLSDEAVTSFRKHIDKRFGPEFLPEKPIAYKTKSKNAQEAHEAVRPTNINTTVEMITKEMGKDEAKLYGLIVDRALASQMANRLSEILTVSLDVDGDSKYTFRLGGEKLLFEGFRKVWRSKTTDNSEELQQIEKLSKGDKFNLDELSGEQKFTKPKARYTDASLVKALEEYGVGRPSTYATIISTVQARGYVEKQGRYIHPMDVGRVVNEFLNTNFEHLVDYNYTAEVEEKLDQISRGEIEYAPFIDDQYSPLIKDIDKAEKNVNKEDVVVLGDSEEKCDKCGSTMYIRLGRYGKFLSCSTFPECKGMKGLDGGEDSLDFEKYERPEKCPDCSKELELKQGKYGKFWACTTYPDCKGTVPMLLKEKCPECESYLVERRSKWGKEFIGCSGYPDCKYIKKEPKKKEKEK